MNIFRFLNRTIIITALVGIAIGIVAVLAAEQVDHYTSTDAFCGTTCHSMEAYVVNDSTYMTSAHRTTPSGAGAGCADCHISKAGIVPATWDHFIGGVKDIYAEIVHDFEDPEVWEQRRAKGAYAVRDKMLANDSANCRFCHDGDAVMPTRTRGRRGHAEAGRKGMTCIACHYNLVHRSVAPRESFLERAELGR